MSTLNTYNLKSPDSANTNIALDASGNVAIQAGSASTPSIYVTGDPNTGLYSPGADQVAISTNGTGRLFVDASGRVGIGTSTPSEGFQVVSSTGYSTLDSIRIGSDGNNDIYKGSGALTISTSDALLFKTGPLTERLRITSAGLVGVGTSSPGSLLTVKSPGAATTFFNCENSSGTSILRLFQTAGGSGRLIVSDSTGTDFFNVQADQGRVGIGTTSPTTALDVRGSSEASIRWGTTSNFYGTLFADATLTALNSYNSNPLAFSVSTGTGFSERARIDSSGRLLVGTSSALGAGDGQYSLLQIRGNSSSSSAGGGISLSRGEAATSISTGELLGQITFTDNGGGIYSTIACEADATAGTNDFPGRLTFSVTRDGSASPSEALRISNNGTTGIFATASDATIYLSTTATAGTATPLIRGRYSGTGVFGGTDSIFVWSNGNIQNTNNSYGAISDIKLKENIVDAGSQWNDLKALQVRKYNFKEGQTHTQIGLVAQEVELVSPGLVTESPDRDEDGNDLGTVTKSVNYSVLYMKAVKALQEAMERIEQLEAKVSALESKP